MAYARVVLVQLALILTPAGHTHAQDADTSFAIVGVNVIPMDDERVLENQTIVVSDGVIQSVSDTAATTLPADLRQIEGNGRYLMPGLADLHIHLRHEDELVNYLAWGVTTVMHLGGSGETGRQQLAFREEIRNGSRLGPNIYTTDRTLDGDPALPNNAHSLTTAEDARKVVQELRTNGFDFVKIYNNVSLPVFEAIIAEAEKQDLSVIGHIPRSFDPLISLGGGQNAIAHTEELFFTYFKGPRSTENMPRDYEPDLTKLPKLIDTLVENNVATMPDLCFTFGNMLMWDGLSHLWGDPEFPYLHPSTASLWERGNINRRTEIENFIVRGQWKYNLMQTLTLEFQKAGILQVIGTDASLPGLYPGKAAHRELTELVKAGISNFDALAIGSRNAGEFVRRYIDENAKFGQILPGYRADLLLLDENPLEDVRNARSVSAVAVNGRFTDKSELDERRAALKNRYEVLFATNNQVDAVLAGNNALTSMQELINTHKDDAEVLATIESRVNSAGYGAAFADDLDRAQQLLALNSQLFPNSANTWDSLGELSRYRGDNERALAYYRKALEVDPDFSNAAENIKQILAAAEE
jgi:tetratricopeptide (TPR) repeat protein